jgi:glycosyltransferase involved in cell wall biosynthesis
MRYFPNTYDPEQNIPNPWVRGKKLRIVYTGTLGGSRQPDVLCQAIEALFTRLPQTRGLVEVVIAGHADRATRAYLATKLDYVDWWGPVSFDQSMDLIRSADVLTLIDNKPPAGPVSDDPYEFFPSKLLDYMLGQRPILGISEAGSLSSTVINNLGLGMCFTHDQVDRLSAALEDKWRAWQIDLRSDFELSELDDSYDARASALRLYQEMKELI